jgi:hypothetical protein
MYIILAILSFSMGIEIGNAADCSKHPIYCQIVTNKPNINKRYAMRVSNIIYRKAKKYDISPKLFTAILAQESMYKLSARNCTTGVVRKSYINFIGEIQGYHYSKTKVCTDFGISQIYYKTAKGHKFDIHKLTTDLEYSISAGMIVLKYFQRYRKKDKNWWTRYNAYDKIKRERYRKLVKRFL